MKLDKIKYRIEPCEDDDNEMFSRKQEKSELFHVPVMNDGGFYSFYWRITDGAGNILDRSVFWNRELIDEQRANVVRCNF